MENGLIVGPLLLLSVNQFDNWLALHLLSSQTILLYPNEVKYTPKPHYTGFIFHENINA